MSRRTRGAVFWTLQLALAAAALSLYVHRSRELASSAPRLPPLRPAPLAIESLYDDPRVVTEEELARVLARLGLRFEGVETRIGNVDHSLRMWGSQAEPPGPEAMRGSDLLRLLIDHPRFEEVYGRGVQPLLIEAPGGGVRVRALEGTASASHVDHTLATLAELGTPLELPIRTLNGESTYRAMVEQSLRDFSLNQPEYEWSALAYALLLEPAPEWTTSEGQAIDFDALAERLRREPLPSGVCSANHRMYGLAAFLQIDAGAGERGEGPLLSGGGRRRILDYLRGVTATFVRHQHPDGFWNGDWPTAAPASREPTDREEDSLATRLIVTGHVLEWWAISPEELQPPREVVIAASRWLVETVDALTADEVQENYSFLSHVGRALALWRGRLPAETDLTGG